MKYNLYVLNSFVSENGGGNAAGVVFETNLSKQGKQSIAAKHKLSEVAFVNKSEVADYKIEFFTPNDEVDMCGHATIATFGLMRDIGMIDIGTYSLETLAGILEIEVMDEVVYMTQPFPEFGSVVAKDEIVQSLNIDESKLLDYQPEMVSTGLFDIMVGICDVESLKAIEPNFEGITIVSEKYDSVGYHLYAFDNEQIYTRNFAPRYAINEESATGSASGALACLLFKYNILKLNIDYTFKQGYFMQSPSNIYVKLCGNLEIEKVLVGGVVGEYTLNEFETA